MFIYELSGCGFESRCCHSVNVVIRCISNVAVLWYWMLLEPIVPRGLSFFLSFFLFSSFRKLIFRWLVNNWLVQSVLYTSCPLENYHPFCKTILMFIHNSIVNVQKRNAKILSKKKTLHSTKPKSFTNTDYKYKKLPIKFPVLRTGVWYTNQLIAAIDVIEWL